MVKKKKTVQGHVYVGLEDDFAILYEQRAFPLDDSWMPFEPELFNTDNTKIKLIIVSREGQLDTFAVYVGYAGDQMGNPNFSICTLDGESLLTVSSMDELDYDLKWIFPKLAPVAIINSYLIWKNS